MLNIHHLRVGTDVELLGFSGGDWYVYRTEKNRAGIPAHQEMARMARPATAGTDSAAKDLRPHHSLHSTYIPKKTGKGVFICLI